jgi:hypothetical protein
MLALVLLLDALFLVSRFFCFFEDEPVSLVIREMQEENGISATGLS